VDVAIRDEFTDLPVSRQRKYQLRMGRDQRCLICGKPAVIDRFCLKHSVANRERTRNKVGWKRRNSNAISYRLEAMAKAAARRNRHPRAE
jgi:hypothetical protein